MLLQGTETSAETCQRRHHSRAYESHHQRSHGSALPLHHPTPAAHSYRRLRRCLQLRQTTQASRRPYRLRIHLQMLAERTGSIYSRSHPSNARTKHLIRRWLKAGVLEDGEIHPNEEGTPQGGSISVLLSNLYLHYVLDLWFERVVKPRLRGEACMVRYIDDFVICFQYRSDAIRVQDALRLRLGKFGLTLEPTKTKLVEFGRFAQKHAGKRGRNRPETIYF